MQGPEIWSVLCLSLRAARNRLAQVVCNSGEENWYIVEKLTKIYQKKKKV